jgi:hypothetical protein
VNLIAGKSMSRTNTKRSFSSAGLLVLLATTVLSACGTTTTAPAEKVLHGFRLEVARGVSEVVNVHFEYGELGQRTASVGRPGAVITTVRAPMVVPDVFTISWDQAGGHQGGRLRVPVRARVPADMKDKTVIFVIGPDGRLEGYVAASTPGAEQPVQFY